jgi:hypothetical protein
MSLKKVIAAATIPAMVASPVAAANNPAASLSLRSESSESADTTAAAAPAEIGQPGAAYAAGSGLSSPLIIGGLAVLLVVIGAVALGSGHHGMHSASA